MAEKLPNPLNLTLSPNEKSDLYDISDVNFVKISVSGNNKIEYTIKSFIGDEHSNNLNSKSINTTKYYEIYFRNFYSTKDVSFVVTH